MNDSVIIISSDSEGELVPGQFSDAESTGLGEITEFEGLGDSARVEGVATLDEDLGEYEGEGSEGCLLYTSPSPRDGLLSRMPSSA